MKDIKNQDRDALRNTARPNADDITQDTVKRPTRVEEADLTPSTDDPTKELAPDDTFPGSGPAHMDDY